MMTAPATVLVRAHVLIGRVGVPLTRRKPLSPPAPRWPGCAIAWLASWPAWLIWHQQEHLGLEDDDNGWLEYLGVAAEAIWLALLVVAAFWLGGAR